jgi:hypothetical protein
MSDTVPGRGLTPRGFTIYDALTDVNGNRVRVQESSDAEEACVWIIVQAAGDGQPRSPHLNAEQAGRVRDALDAWIRERAGG